MKRCSLLTLSALLCVLLAFVAIGCTSEIEPAETSPESAITEALSIEITAAEEKESVTDPVTEAPTDPVTEAPTEAPTNPPALIEQAFEEHGEGDTIPCDKATPLPQKYEEPPVVVSDSRLLADDRSTAIYYTSTFYGHDSAIDRDLMQYGWSFAGVSLEDTLYRGECYFAEMTGDLYDDMIVYEDGELRVYPAVVTTNKTFEYNGITYDSVYADKNSDYSFGEPRIYYIPFSGTLRGVADFNGDGYNDFLFVKDDGTLIVGYGRKPKETRIKVAFDSYRVGKLNGDPQKLYVGDVNGDRCADLLYIEEHTVTVAYKTGNHPFNPRFTLGEPVTLPFDEAYDRLNVGDINNDGRVDIAWFIEESKKFRSVFGRGDGSFGPHADEMGVAQGNTNLYALSERLRLSQVQYFALGDITGDGVPDILTHANGGTLEGFSLLISASDPPYDYSLFGMLTEEGTYKMFAGGRWYDQSEAVKDSLIGDGYGDGDHVMMYFSEDGIHWQRHIDGPAFYLGLEQGQDGWEEIGDGWWTGNTLEPEVVYVDGVYHMILQSSGLTQSGWYGDYLNYASSSDGIHFIRKTDSPIILPEPGKDFTQFKEIYGFEIGFNHHELIYVPDDPDGKVFHLYAGHFSNNNWAGYVRIRSSDPTTFYWSDRESTSGFSQIGNQIGYINNYDGEGNRLYLRITFHDYADKNGSRSVPTLQYSFDGLNFRSTSINLASVDVTNPISENNRNVYFLGFCTLNGTGEIPQNEDGSYQLIYLATTANAPGGMPIFWAEAGVGVMDFTLK
ncbi:MAG: VCBS repeat-containing protein [Clostridia bacterium]|nr:VCBS repeat-containing protein [Clostridia bacterium]